MHVVHIYTYSCTRLRTYVTSISKRFLVINFSEVLHLFLQYYLFSNIFCSLVVIGNSINCFLCDMDFQKLHIMSDIKDYKKRDDR